MVSSTRTVRHQITIAALPEVVYGLIAGAGRWPQIFEPTVHVDYLSQSADTERFRIWAYTDHRVRTWVSRRRLHPAEHRVEFWREVSQPPTRSMIGEWILEADGGGSTLVTLCHTFSAVDDDPAGLDWITRMTDRNSEKELAGLRELVENGRATADELTFSFEDSVQVRGEVADVYDFIYRAAQWPDRLPHVAKLDLTEETPGVQVMDMDTSRPDGSTHRTHSVRICFPAERIVYKQFVTPASLSGHTGEWSFERSGDEVVATSRHTVILDPSGVAKVFGADTGIERAKTIIRDRIGSNSRTTLECARSFVESALMS